ncbi:hypothetical protein Jab_2c07590 [Janthinobacterium sp. HH01]|uniref:hypothetical protein n=1 Tax=Janthinobacterium sp. HH01 TaxID=1198452 RepID=UPI0002AEA5B2|nr:hypothetical protein [Janthinobacterium sp. HH01]ELX08704.1 hypothetical protein Jab_2c07590 [Janthinobacterium sp. HH01]
MPKLAPSNTPDILLKLTDYVGINLFPPAQLQQRGPSCGFSALAYTLEYWHEKLKLTVPPPLPARTQMSMDGALAQTREDKETKRKNAAKGEFVSLRQFAKFNALTVVGSVFSAENLLRVATHAQPGVYEGLVDTVANVDEFAARILFWLGQGVPVIVPYDADETDSEPIENTGLSAHWVTVLGCCSVGGAKQLLYFNWGAFYYAPLAKFALSNLQLRNNKHVPFRKYEVYRDSAAIATRTPIIRDYMTAETVKLYQEKHKLICVEMVDKEVRTDRQYNDPATASSSSSSSSVSSAAIGAL